jgi:hypothetical protein
MFVLFYLVDELLPQFEVMTHARVRTSPCFGAHNLAPSVLVSSRCLISLRILCVSFYNNLAPSVLVSSRCLISSRILCVSFYISSFCAPLDLSLNVVRGFNCASVGSLSRRRYRLDVSHITSTFNLPCRLNGMLLCRFLNCVSFFQIYYYYL